jgi:hypothetical protein
MPNRAQAIAGRVWSVTVRLARYLGPLLRETVAYLWRLSLDAAGGVRILFMYWRARRNPASAGDYAGRQAQVRERRAARWAGWRELTATRRMEVRAAAVSLAAIALVTLRIWWGPRELAVYSSNSPAPDSGVAGTSASAVQPAADSSAATSAPAVDVRQVVARFAADRQHLRAGEWAVLAEPLVIERGPLGAWDDYAVSQPVVLRDDINGMPYRMWFRGCRMAMREYSCGVGHATSRDGIVWNKAPRPVHQPPDAMLREGLDEIAIVKAGGRYFLWYSVTADPFKGRKRPILHLATSSDGLAWVDEGRVMDGGNDFTPFLSHSVFHDGRTFHLWHVTKVPETSPVLQHFSSADGKTWTELGGTATEDLESRPSVAMGRLAIVTAVDGQFLGLFTHDPDWQASAVLGSLSSPDGTTWTATNVDPDPLRAWSSQYLSVFSLSRVLDREGLWLWTGLRSLDGPMRVGLAFRKGGES